MDLTNRLFTDDSFQFSDTIRQIKGRFEDYLNLFYINDGVTVHLGKEEVTNSSLEEKKEDLRVIKTEDYEFTLSSRVSQLLGSRSARDRLLEDLLIEATDAASHQYKFEWAQSSINILTTEIYKRKNLLSQGNQERMDEMISRLKDGKLKSKDKLLKANDVDRSILGNPLQSRNEVKDNRGYAFSIDGSQTWASKQFGL
eukprot:TRINITY_DN8361_c0_g1_i2.p1 TRINITY_DN8361_c0_g1~~TRINITY_DN8361_c0_g1_i2.p1  ORF type:complete len:199 (+),score=23.70 TRINITY_DN8361_c0_g1_i2:233-829(+)